jgi:hypothetical protein
MAAVGRAPPQGADHVSTTPAGGVRAAAWWFDEQGERVNDPALAARGEIHEYDAADRVINRTYVEPSDGLPGEPMSATYDEAVHPDNADLLKAGTWDVRNPDQTPVTTLEQLLASQGWSDLPLRTQRHNVAAFTAWPVWVPAPAELREEVDEWLVSTRQE